MSYELLGILLLGVAEIATFIVAISGFREMSRNFAEVSRIQRAIAGLITQESMKRQDQLRT